MPETVAPDNALAERLFDGLMKLYADPIQLAKQHFSSLLVMCESPIEEHMLFALGMLAFECGALVEHLPPFHPSAQIKVLPQHAIGSYRADFAVLVHPHRGGELRIAIECDGHDFHERTKEQAMRDKQRDRFFVIEGWHVLRFTGSEIWNDISACAVEIAELIDTKLGPP